MLPPLDRLGKGAYVLLSLLVSFGISAVASIVAYYICKWLDRDRQLAISPGSTSSQLKDGENPSSANYWGFCCTMGQYILKILVSLSADIIAYDFYLRNIHFPSPTLMFFQMYQPKRKQYNDIARRKNKRREAAFVFFLRYQREPVRRSRTWSAAARGFESAKSKKKNARREAAFVLVNAKRHLYQ